MADEPISACRRPRKMQVESAEVGNVTEVTSADDAPAPAIDAEDAAPADDNQGLAVRDGCPHVRSRRHRNVSRVEGDEPLYLVQLAAFRNAATAREQAGLLSGKHQTRLAEVELGTMKVDAGENGIFWRVVTEPLARLDADALCASLKRAGQECILRKFTEPSS